MTDKQLRRLHRRELLEILFELRKRLDSANGEIAALKEQLAAARAEKLCVDKAFSQLDALYVDRFGEYVEPVPDTLDESDENDADDELE